MPPQALRVLWTEFKEVSLTQLILGQRVWAALRSPGPKALYELIAGGTPELPTLAIAIQRHLRQLPSAHNGLNLSENLTLKILADKGSMNAARLFGRYTNHYEPLSFMGDTGYGSCWKAWPQPKIQQSTWTSRETSRSNGMWR